jgi:hypothetical protein
MKRPTRTTVAITIAVPATILAFLAFSVWVWGPRESRLGEEREIIALTVERDSLLRVVTEAAGHSAVLARFPVGDVVIGLPTPFVTDLVQDIAAAWFRDVELELHDVQVHKAGEVRARMGFLGRRRVGRYDLDLTLDEVRGRMRAGVPTLTYGGDVIGITLPVHISGGSATATLAFDWESKGLASPVCGDLAATRTVTGTVRPADHVARGRILLSARAGAIVADPEFPELAVRLFPVPDSASVAVLDSLLDTKGGLCGIAVDRFRPGARILELVERGFNVRIPQKFFRPIRLPIAVETALDVQERNLALAVRPRDLSVTPAMVWLGADVEIRPREPRAPR